MCILSRSPYIVFLVLLAAFVPIAISTTVKSSEINDPTSKIVKPFHETHCRSVTVYHQSAEITREFSLVNLNQGETTITLDDFPSNIDVDSIRVKGTGAATIVDIDHVVSVRNNDNPADGDKVVKTELEELQESLRNCIEKFNSLSAENERLIKLNGFYDNLSKLVTSVSEDVDGKRLHNNGSIMLKDWSDFAAFYMKGLTDVDIKLATVKLESERQGKLCRDLETKLQILQQPVDKTSIMHSLKISLEVSVANADITLIISYSVPYAASWTPSYDIKIDTESGKTLLVMYGRVKQSTGEDWTNVSMSLSSVDPLRHRAKPVVNPIDVDFYDDGHKHKAYHLRAVHNAPTSDAGMRAGGAMPMFGEMSTSFAESAAPSQRVVSKTAHVDSTTTSTRYHIKGNTSILGDGTVRRIVISEVSNLLTSLTHFVAPSISESAWLVANITNSDITPLLPGVASVFVDNTFMSKSNLPYVALSTSFSLDLGVDNDVTISKSQLKKSYDESGGWVSTEIKKIACSETVTITNNKKIIASIVVEKSVPRPVSSDISVTMITPSIKPQCSLNMKLCNGAKSMFDCSSVIFGKKRSSSAMCSAILSSDYILKWTLSLPPNSEPVVLPMEYEAQWPNSKTIIWDSLLL